MLKDLNDNVEAQVNHYLVPPSSEKMLDQILDDDKLGKIEAYVRARAEVLAQEKHEEMEELLNEIIHEQMKKIRAQTAFIKDFD